AGERFHAPSRVLLAVARLTVRYGQRDGYVRGHRQLGFCGLAVSKFAREQRFPWLTFLWAPWFVREIREQPGLASVTAQSEGRPHKPAPTNTEPATLQQAASFRGQLEAIELKDDAAHPSVRWLERLGHQSATLTAQDRSGVPRKSDCSDDTA